MPRTDILRRPQPFLGLLLVAAGWALSHQFGSDGVFDDCTSRGGGYVVLVSITGLFLIGAGGLYAFSARRSPRESGRGFLGIVTGLLSLVAAFAVILQIAAGLILPPCAA